MTRVSSSSDKTKTNRQQDADRDAADKKKDAAKSGSSAKNGGATKTAATSQPKPNTQTGNATEDGFGQKAQDALQTGIETAKQGGMKLFQAAAGLARDAKSVAYHTASFAAFSPKPSLNEAAQRGPAEGDKTHLEFDVQGKLMVGLDVKAVNAAVGGKVKATGTETTTNLGNDQYQFTAGETLEIAPVGQVGVGNKKNPLSAAKYSFEGTTVISVKQNYETDGANINNLIDGHRVERASDTAARATGGVTGAVIDAAVNPTGEQQQLLDDSYRSTEVEIRSKDRHVIAGKMDKLFGLKFPNESALEAENRADLNYGVRLKHEPARDGNPAAVEYTFFAGVEDTSKHNVGTDTPIGGAKASSLADHYRDELAVTVRVELDHAQNIGSPEDLVNSLDGLAQDMVPTEVEVTRKTRGHQPIEDEGARVFFDSTHSPYTQKTTRMTIDSEGARPGHVAALLSGHPDAVEALKDRTSVEQTVEHVDPEPFGPVDADLGAEVKVALGKKRELGIGVEAEAVTHDVVDRTTEALGIREGVGEMLRPLPLAGEGKTDAATTSGDAETGATARADGVVLGRGSAGPEVESLQTKLTELGYDLETDGVYGDETAAQVRAFQTDAEIHVDGMAGPETFAALDQALAEARGADAPVSGPGTSANGPDGVIPTDETGDPEGVTRTDDAAETSAVEGTKTIAEDGWPQSISTELLADAQQMQADGVAGVELITRSMDQAFTHYSEEAGYAPQDAMDATMRDMASIFSDQRGVDHALGMIAPMYPRAADMLEQVNQLPTTRQEAVADPTQAEDFRPRFRDLAEDGSGGHNQIYHTMAYIIGGYVTGHPGVVDAGAVAHEASANSGYGPAQEADARVGSVGGDLGTALKNLRDGDPSLEEARSMMTLVGAHLAADGGAWGDADRSWNRGVDRSPLAQSVDDEYDSASVRENVVGGLGFATQWMPDLNLPF